MADEIQLLRFRAPWCPPCLQQKRIFDREGMAAYLKQQNIKDVYIDVDSHKSAVTAWKVESIPCTILVSVNEKGEATVIRKLGGDKLHPHRLMAVEAYKAFVTTETE